MLGRLRVDLGFGENPLRRDMVSSHKRLPLAQRGALLKAKLLDSYTNIWY
jgi:hypothetical protein